MRASVAALAGLAALCCSSAVSLRAQQNPVEALNSQPLQKSTLDEYRLHLQKLQTIVSACSAERNPTACNPAQVGPDDEVAIPTGSRPVRYAWLRSALQDAAGDLDSKSIASKSNDKPTTPAEKNAALKENAARLQDAAQRLDEDVATAGGPPAPAQPTEQVRRNLTTVLAQREFNHVQQPSLIQRGLTEALGWLFKRLSSMAAYGGRNPWIAHLLEAAGIVIPCTLLLWWVLQQSRRRRDLVLSAEPVEATAPSARAWQHWMQEAEIFANERRWREAVHHVYWAAISRIEARGLWAADRARTPREYLALLHQDHTLLPDLRRLTRTFERIWYGHRPAEEQQYRDACALMERLMPR